MIQVPKRTIKFDIEGRVFEAKELSAFYIMDATTNPSSDTVDNAILDSMGVISNEDLHLFGRETKNILYAEIVKFTFQDKTINSDIEEISEALKLSKDEIKSLSMDAQVQLKNIINNRKPNSKESGKKH